MVEHSRSYVSADYLIMAGRLFEGIKQRSYELLGDLGAASVLDIGCGAGLDTVSMGLQAGERSRVWGIDLDAEMVALAQRRTRELGLAQRVRHRVADACDLPFGDAQFDAVRSERLLMHLPDPAAALAEAVRVTRPQGRLVMIDTDWGSLSTATAEVEIERCLARFRAEKIFPNGYSGRRLYGLMAAAGLQGIVLEPVAIHLTDLALWRFITRADDVERFALERRVLSREALQRWRAALEDASEKKAFFGSVTVVMAAAQRRSVSVS